MSPSSVPQWQDPLARAELEQDLLAYLRSEDLNAPDEDRFAPLARRVFQHQFAHNRPYQRFCLSRGVTPDSYAGWWQAPAVPTDVFKSVDLATFPESRTVATFLTSGTTRGEARGRHRFASLAPYEAAILPMFRRYLLPHGERMPMYALVAPAEELPDSSLSYMVRFVMERLGGEGSRYFWTGGTLRIDALVQALEAAAAAGQAIMLLGTAFAFVHLFDSRPGWSVRLPAGSRLMETGGFKGRVREVGREELYSLFSARLGLPASHCVAEYGMTELSSQLYDSSLRAVTLGRPTRRVLEAPPWLKVTVVDPITLQARPAGELGLIRFFDLANLDSVSAIQTSDVGRITEAGLELMGRAPDAEARGCSLTAEELLRMSPERLHEPA